MTPTLQTERVTLRPYQRSDFGTDAAFMASGGTVRMDNIVYRHTHSGNRSVS